MINAYVGNEIYDTDKSFSTKANTSKKIATKKTAKSNTTKKVSTKKTAK